MAIIADEWKDYECIDLGNGEKLERWKNIVLRRPDPWNLWPISNENLWHNIHAFYHRNNKGGGYWEYKKKIPNFWTVNYENLTFKVAPTDFKHTGLFPEQAANWDFYRKCIEKSNKKNIKILNLFAYTGGATMACSNAGASEVVHVDAAKGMNNWAKENMNLSNLQNNNIRFITEDCIKFIEREIRRGNKYDGIIMDPPSYGRGPNGELFKLEEKLYELILKASNLLSDNPLFFTINCYTVGFTCLSLKNILSKVILKKYPNYNILVDELCLPVSNGNILLPCGITGRIYNET
ncbi:MAG: class I SAM-dependent methyltransferase [Bacilli bacterium]